MKKICYITFIFLAFVFAFKSLTFVAISSKMAFFCDIDLNENESENEKHTEIKMKGVFEEGKLSDSSKILILNSFIKPFPGSNSESIYFQPYFEVSSPPPEIV